MGDREVKAATRSGAVPVQSRQSSLNESTRGQWALYASHRQSIERLLVAALPPGPRRICVLGAGNCNDLDLAWLTQVCAEVHLLDLDAAALSRALERQGVAGAKHVSLHAPIDLSAIACRVDRWSGRPPGEAEIDVALTEIALAPTPSLPGPFELVLSPCVLSQMFNPARDAMGASHPRFAEVLAALRARHLRTVVDLLAPGGTGIVANDVSSNERFEQLPFVPPKELPALLRQLVRKRKCFGGLEPAAVQAALERDGRVARCVQSNPWLWHLSLQRTYLVYALSIHKKR